jgi:hypothetical protein
MTRLAAEMLFGVAPERARVAALHAAQPLERDFNGRRDGGEVIVMIVTDDTPSPAFLKGTFPTALRDPEYATGFL